MKASDIVKLAASIAAGSITYGAACDQLDDDGDISLLDRVMAGGAGAIVGGLAAGVTGILLKETGAGDMIDDVVGGLFDW